MKKNIILSIVLVLILCVFGYLCTFTVDNIEIAGCEMSSQDVVRQKLEGKFASNNTLITYFQNKFSPVEDIPFVAKIDLQFEDKHNLRADVYEKSVAGCLEYMESYVYFDRDGIVLETSKSRLEGVPYIKGLTIKSWELGKELPIENKQKFNTILTITQLIDKYNLDIQGIEFTVDGEVVLRHDNIEIELGDGDNLPIQLMNLGNILKELKGMNGVLYMKEYNSENSSASFKVR